MEPNVNFKEVEILLIEDDPNDVELILRTLKKYNLGNQVYVVKDGEEALEFIFATGRYAERGASSENPKSENPKVILLDLKLPKVSGLEVLKKVKADDRTKSIPIVAVTSSKENNDLKESYALGINSYVIKPLKFEDFAEALTKVGLYWLIINKSPREV